MQHERLIRTTPGWGSSVQASFGGVGSVAVCPPQGVGLLGTRGALGFRGTVGGGALGSGRVPGRAVAMRPAQGVGVLGPGPGGALDGVRGPQGLRRRQRDLRGRLTRLVGFGRRLGAACGSGEGDTGDRGGDADTGVVVFVFMGNPLVWVAGRCAVTRSDPVGRPGDTVGAYARRRERATEFRYSDLLPIGPDETPYRLVTTEGVSTFEAVDGQRRPSSRWRRRRSSG